MTADLLRLLEESRPGASRADLLAMIEALPDRPARKAQDGHSRHPGIFQPRKPQRPPERSKSIERRRRLAYSGPLPPQIAACFTLGELAVLRIVGDEVRERGFCGLTLGAIAARAGCCRELARRTMRKAHREELLTIEERRRPGQVNLANVVRIISREWLAWLARGPKKSAERGTFSNVADRGHLPKGIGATEIGRTDKGFRKQAESRSTTNVQNGFRQARGAGTMVGNEILSEVENHAQTTNLGSDGVP